MPEEFAGQLSEQAAFARAVQFFIAVRAGDLPTVRRLLQEAPALVAEHERWDAEMARRNRRPAVRSYTALHRAADATALARARRVLLFGSQPFFVAEPYTAKPGTHVPLEATIRGYAGLIGGAHDELEEEAVRFIGAL